jgi:peptide/nickel transport system permease protein
MSSAAATAASAGKAVDATPAAAAGQSLGQWQLIWRRFRRHKLAVVAGMVLLALYMTAAFAEFIAPYPAGWQDLSRIHNPPQPPRLSLEHGLHVYGTSQHVDPVTFQKVYVPDRETTVPLGFFVQGEPYKLWGLIEMRTHLFGVDRVEAREMGLLDAEGNAPGWYLLGADKHGQDIFSRILYGARISLSIGIVAIFVTFVLGGLIGGVSGYIGGSVDNFIQRGIEIINAFPKLPLWLAMGAALPPNWSALKTYFGITIVLSLLGWTGLARVIRGKLLSLREEDYAVAARLIGAGHGRIIFRHLMPGFTSHIIVAITLSIPGMILGETSLSFLGLGLRPPVVSWGVMLQDCMNMQTVANYPWLLLPVVFIILTVLSFNFLGDGLRDAADPYSA